MVFISFWLTSLCVIGSRFIHLIRTQMRSFYGWVIFHCAYVSQLPYPCICRWTSRLLPCSSYCKWCCNEQWDTYIFFNFGFFRVCLLFWKNFWNPLVIYILSYILLILWLMIWFDMIWLYFSFIHLKSTMWDYVKVRLLVVPNVLLSSSCTILAGHRAVLNKNYFPTSLSVNRRDKWKFCFVPLGEKGVPSLHLFLPFHWQE